MDRSTRLLSTTNRTSRILEIGPSHAPIAPKAGGWNTCVVDHASREELQRKYASANVNLEAIEEVDVIWAEGVLADAVPATLHGSFETLIASHVIEHIPDFVGFLISAQRLLSPTGTMVLAVPDKRFCFDYFKPLTNTGDVLEAQAGRRTRHPLHTVWSQAAYSVTLDGAIAWNQHPIGGLAFVEPFTSAAAALARFRDDAGSPYLDCHMWHFTPASFALVTLELGQLGIIDWRVDGLHGPEGCEFYVFLRRGAETIDDPAVLQQRRMALLRRQMMETREQIDFALGAGPVPAGEKAIAVASSPQRIIVRGHAMESAFGRTVAPPAMDDLALTRRIRAAYRAVVGSPSSERGSMWLDQIAERKRDVHQALMDDDEAHLQALLRNPVATELLYGFESLSRSLAALPLDESQLVAHLTDVLLRLGESRGCWNLGNPEQPTAEPPPSVEQMLTLLDQSFGCTIDFPAPFGGEVGLSTARGIVSYRAIQALYQAGRVVELVHSHTSPRVLEIGAGLGRTAYYAWRLGIRDYTIIDIPMTAVAQANFLGRTLGEEHISLYPETGAPGIRILPPAAFLNADDHYDLIINVDSLTEMGAETAGAYVRQAESRSDVFWSVNHEANPFRVRDLFSPNAARNVARTPHWMRAGYVEELLDQRKTERRGDLIERLNLELNSWHATRRRFASLTRARLFRRLG